MIRRKRLWRGEVDAMDKDSLQARVILIRTTRMFSDDKVTGTLD